MEHTMTRGRTADSGHDGAGLASAGARPFVVLVCGSRGWADEAKIDDVLIRVVPTEAIVVTGGALGADGLAERWAERNGRQRVIVPANWKKNGRAAGPIRNQLMLDLLSPRVVVAFDMGTPGTADMIRRAEKAGLTVVLVHA